MIKNIIWGKDINESLDEKLIESNFSDEKLQSMKDEFWKTPIDDILYVLEQTGQLMIDKNKKYYNRSMEILPELLGYSPSMVRLGISMLQDVLSIDSLSKRLNVLKDYHSIDYPCDIDNNITYALPVGSVCHIAAGNIFLGAIDSLLYGIVTKNINIVKVSKKSPDFAYIFFEALKEADKNNILIPYISIIYWDRMNQSYIEDYMKQHCDIILLFGGREAVLNYKNGTSHKVNVVAFGPKLSFGLITKDLSYERLEEIAMGFAKDIVMWEQNACTSCQNIFIEEDANTQRFIELLNESLEILGVTYENEYLTIDEKLEIRRTRSLYRYEEYEEKAKVIEGKRGHHTIIINHSKDIQDSPLFRTIYINIIKDYKDILEGNINGLQYYMSTIGVAANNNYQQIIDDFSILGVYRFCSPGNMSLSSEESSLHDGVNITSCLIRQIGFEDLPYSSIGLSNCNKNKKEAIVLSKINAILKQALKSTYYKELYKDIQIPVKSLEDFSKLPVLTSKALISQSPNMLTDKNENSYVFSSGGSSGKEKFVWYSAEEFSKSKEVFGIGFKNIGITKDDFVVNYLKAGSLWTAFLATNKGLEKTGCRILSLTANQCKEDSINIIKKLKPNAIMGIPGTLILLAQKAEELNEDITFEKIYYSGNHMAESGEKYLKKVFKCSVIKSFGYAAVETGPIGYQCPHCKPSEYHVFEDWCYVEKDEDNNILITDLERKLHPIIKYKLGDNIEYVEGECSCGNKSPKIRLISRNDDVIRLNDTDLYLYDIDQVIKKNDYLSPFYQIEIDKDEGTLIKIHIRIETIQDMECNEEFVSSVLDSIKKQTKALGKFSSKNLIGHVYLELLEPETIKRNFRTGKIRKVIDNRYN